jgi:hypothetical protein
VQLKLGTRHRKYSLHTLGKERAEITSYSAQPEDKAIRRVRSDLPQDESQVSDGGLLALRYGSKQRVKQKRWNGNYVEDTMTDIGSK